MNIAIDLDGVVYEFQRTFRYMLNTYRGAKLGPVETWWTSWDACDRYTTEQDREWIWTEGVRLGLFRYGHVVTGAIFGLRGLIDRGDSLYVATHRPASAVPDTLAWLSYINIPWTGVHILSNGESKTDVDADVLVDDRTENVMEWSLSGRRAVLFDRPWNTGLRATNVYRARGWEEVTDAIGNLRP
jgi:5'(3')-deoxyribonucleotidase